MKKLLILSFLSFLLNGIVSSNYWPHTWRNHATTVRLLIIGDSVDRNSVLDWCANNDGNLCQPYRFCGPGAGFKFEGFSKLFPIKRFQQINRYWNLSFSEFFSPSRHSQDSVRVCFLERENLVVSFLFNPNGVRALPYCSDERSPDNSDEVFSHMDELRLPNVTIPYFIQFSLLPKVTKLKKIVGGDFHGMLIQSSLWDLKRVEVCEKINMFQSKDEAQSLLRARWLKEWTRNATTFAVAMKRSAFASNASYLAWRTMHQLPLDESQQRSRMYLNAVGHETMKAMTVNAERIAKAAGIDLIEFHKFPNIAVPRHPRYDAFHPNHRTSLALVEELINRTLQAIATPPEDPDISMYWPHRWTNHDSTVRLLVIGDSVDRNAVLDWCTENDGSLCQPYRFCGPGAGFRFAGNKSFSEFFSPSRHYQDSVKVCFVERRNLIVSYVFNHNGVSPSPYCSDERTADNSDEVFAHWEDLKQPNVTLQYFIQFSLLPKMPKLKRIVGGDFHGVLMQSSLWDLFRPESCDKVNIFEAGKGKSRQSLLRVRWLKEWTRNATTFAVAMKRSAFASNASYVAWRTMHQLPLDDKSQLRSRMYLNAVGHETMKAMTVNAEGIAKAAGIDLIEFHKFPNIAVPRHPRYDALHPNYRTSLALVEELINRTLQAIEKAKNEFR